MAFILHNEATFVALQSHARLVESRHPKGTVTLWRVEDLGGNDTGKVLLTFRATLGAKPESYFYFQEVVIPTRTAT